ncbi:MAG: lipid-transfer protein [Acidimicrobiia bacterium]|nr:lipid-transfer protein [Acidimicrobiia bacterium]
MARDAAIAGIGQTEFAKSIARPEQRLAVEAALAALADAGLTPAHVDGMVRFDMETTEEVQLQRALGIPNLRFFASTGYGGGGGCGTVALAQAAIVSGQAEVVLAWRARKRGSGGRPWARAGHRVPGEKQWYVPFGLVRPVDQVAILARRMMHEVGVTEEMLGAVAVQIRRHANRNPHAVMRDRKMDLADYLASRHVSEPLRVPDCCLETDGALAVVVTTLERARDLRHTPAVVAAAQMGTGVECVNMTNYHGADLLAGPGAAVAPHLYRMAGIGPEDIDCAQLYDAFTPLVLQSLEDYGFCGRGEAGPFCAEGNLSADGGALPTCTSGGGLSEAYVHGYNLILEGVRQVRGDSVNQVDACEHVLVTSGNAVPTSALVLRRDR